jgi:hypothetical protein
MNYLYDVSFTADYGFIAVGQTSKQFSPDQVDKMWALKVDSIGCEIPNCWVGIEENDGMEAWGQGSGEAWKHGSMEIWPNPASGVLSVKCLGLSSGSSCLLSVYDIYGRVMKEISVPENESEIQINVGDFPQGLYLVVLNDGSKIIGSSKLIISRRN